MNRSERLQALLRLEGLAAAARALAAEHRVALNAEATAEYEREGAAPTWRLADLGSITLPISHETPFVQDPAAFIDWCRARYSTEVETVAQVRPNFLAAFLKRAQPAGEIVMDPSTGEIIPGLGVRPGGIPKALTIRATPAAEAVYAAVGRRELADLLAPAETEDHR